MLSFSSFLRRSIPFPPIGGPKREVVYIKNIPLKSAINKITIMDSGTKKGGHIIILLLLFISTKLVL
jgi:hypothetical protein